MIKLRVDLPGREYDIIVGNGILENAGELIRTVYNGARAAIVTDSNVYPLYAGLLEEALRAVGIEPHTFMIPAGEGSKSSVCLDMLYEDMLGMNIARSELVIALGGGVVGDLTGYAACTLLRGIPFVQIPTTLLAQVDSSVGGKVAINHPLGKNLIGAFYQPLLVIADAHCVRTLDERVFLDGMGEVIKHGAIADKGLFELLAGMDSALDCLGIMDEIVYKNCDIKRSVVEQDEKESGPRMMLNFGHTFGHAIEKYYNFERYTHGEAVAIGMVMACELGEKLGVTKIGTAEKVKELIGRFGLPSSAAVDTAELISAMMLDKKRDGDTLRFVLLKEIGESMIYQVKAAHLGEILA